MNRTSRDTDNPTGVSYRLKAWVLPVVIILVAFAAMALMIKLRPEVEKQERVSPPPLVRVLQAAPTSHRFIVRSQGTVTPRTESMLVPEVSGRVVSVSPAFNAGGHEPKRGREQYVPMFQDCGVNMHLSGRCRFYQRFHPLYVPGTDRRSSIVYVITGAATWGFDDPTPNPAVAASAKKRHYILFSGDGAKLSGRVKDLEGNVIDRFTIVREQDGSYADSHFKGAQEAPR